MDSLLRWSIENSTPRSANAPPLTRKDLDPGIIDYLLGKPDAVLMKEALEIALDENQGEDARIQALEDFEMLVENIDNANGTQIHRIFSLPGLKTHGLVFRPHKAEDVGSIAIPPNVQNLVR